MLKSIHFFKMKLLFPILVTFAFAALSSAGDAPVIEISEGKIKGDDKESREDRDFYAYRGIPYAKKPKGDLRFEPPQPPSNWSGVKETDDYEKQCLQYDIFSKKVSGDEDCLYLNVFTPRFGDGVSKNLLPVMVYIHGGFFMSGSANSYKPHYFMDHEVVMVTFNYRVGALGFLNTQDGLIRGNMGLKDQVMALKWVQRNIRKFGGDPNKVTLFGEGAGASSVHFHMLSPMSKGLFHRAISQSGTALNPYALQPRPVEAAQRLARTLNCKATLNVTKISGIEILENSTSLVECLKKVDAKKIAEAHKETWSPLRHPLSVFLPSVETTHKQGNDTFLTEHPFSIIISGRQRRIPWMTGYNADEGLHVTAKIQHNQELINKVENSWNDYSGKFLVYDNSRSDITKALRQYYIDNVASPDISHPPSTTTTTTTTPTTTRPGVSPQLYPTLPPLPGGARAVPAHQVLPVVSPVVTSAPITTHNNASGHLPPPSPTYALENFESNLINFEEKFSQVTRLFTDRFFATPIFQTVHIQAAYSPIYMYYNNYQGQFSFVDVYAGKTKEPVNSMQKAKTWFKTKILGRTVQQPKHLGVCHGDELPLLFKYSEGKVKENTKDYQMSRDLVKLWLDFAKAEPRLTFRNITWTPLEISGQGVNRVLQFSNYDQNVKILDHVFVEQKTFWDKLQFLAPFQQ